MADKEAPIHAKLRSHRKSPSVKRLAAILDEHHTDLPPAFVWAPDLLAVLVDMQKQIDGLKAELEEAKK